MNFRKTWSPSVELGAGCVTYRDLPEQTRGYVERIEDMVKVKIEAVSVGARRKLTIMRRSSFF